MPYLGNSHIAGDQINNFKVLDDISSHTSTFDGSASGVVSISDNTIRIPEHRFLQGQRVTYNNGGGGNIGNLSSGTAYYIISDTSNTIKLATSLSNANNSVAINLSVLGSGSSHTLNIAFDGVNTKFKITHNGGTSGRINNATQLSLAINNVIQRPNQNATTFTEGFAIEDQHKIVFKVAPISSDVFWGSILANTLPTFDISDNKIDNFTGDGSTTEFNLSNIPASNKSIMVTINGVLQHPSDGSTSRSYTLLANILQFTAAPGNGDEIQVRHIGFAGASTSDVTGFYGRTGNVVLTSNDHITTGNINAGVVTATTFVGNLTGNVSGNLTVGGVLTYEDVTNVDSIGIITARSGFKVLAGGANVVGVITARTNIHLEDYIHHLGDLTTKIGFPSANNITFETAGTKRLCITSGNIGIGTDNPSEKLDIISGTNSQTLRIWSKGNSNSSSLMLRTGDSGGAFIKFGDNSDNDIGQIHYSNSQEAMRFVVNTEETLRITSANRVGIGTTNPTQKVQINNDVDDPNIVLLYGADTSTEYAGIGVFEGNATFTGGGIGSNDTGISLRTASGGIEEEKVHIQPSGNVGIGTGDPNALLDIGGNTDGNIQAIMTRGSDKAFQIQFRNETSSNDAHTSAGKFGLFRNAVEIVGMEFLRGDGVGAGSLAFTNKDGETLRITSDGEMGVNTDAPVEKLGISGNMRFVNPNGTTSRITALPSGSYSTGISGGSAICFQRIADGGGGSDEIFFETHWQGNRHGESCRINKFGNLVFPSGQGIDFHNYGTGTNIDSNLLDDYEEGSWTPAYSSTGGTYAYTTQDGHYTKVGNMVTVACYIRTSSVSATSHNLVKVTGLPFAEGASLRTPGSIRVFGFQASGTFQGFPIAWTVEANQTFGELLKFSSTGTTDFTSSTMNNVTNVYLQATYYVS